MGDAHSGSIHSRPGELSSDPIHFSVSGRAPGQSLPGEFSTRLFPLDIEYILEQPESTDCTTTSLLDAVRTAL